MAFIEFNLIYYLYCTDSEAPTRFSWRDHHGSETTVKELETSSSQDKTNFVKRSTSKQEISNENVNKYSIVAPGNRFVEQETNGVAQNESEGSKAVQIPRLAADYGILGMSDDEDSAKWAAQEITKIPLKPSNSEQLSQQVQKPPQPIKSKGNTFYSTGITQAAPPNSNFSQGAEIKASEKATLADVLPTNKIITNQTKAGPLTKNATMKTTHKNGQVIGQSIATSSFITVQPSVAQGDDLTAQNNTFNGVKVAQKNSKTAQNHLPHNGTSGLGQTTKDVEPASEGLFLSESNETLKNDNFSSQGVPVGKHETEDKAPSLSINFTSLRTGQSFDLHMPTSLNSKVEDNHVYITPQTPSQSTSPQLSQESKSTANSGYFLNKTLDKVKAEKAKEQQSTTLLQRLNSDIVAGRAEPLTSNVNSGTEVTDEAFREEAPTDRMFADNLLEATKNQALLSQKSNDAQGREGQTKIQQDESLARALNASSVSSVIYSANQAIFDTDKQVFSKKSAQEDRDPKGYEYKNERSNYLSRLSKRRIASALSSKRKQKKKHQKATARQVISLGNHYLWFGSQSSADANGFPRHSTDADNSQYNVNSYASNVLNSDNENEASKATTGYKALQNALSSMESNKDAPGDSEFQFGLPSVQKDWQDTNQGQAPTSVVIQDDAGKPVYQGLVHIVKVNRTKSKENVSSEVENATNNQEDKVSNKNKAYSQNETLSNANITNEGAVTGMINALKFPTIQQDRLNNQTDTRDGTGTKVHEDDANFTVSEQKQVSEMNSGDLSKQNPVSSEQMQSEFKDQQKPSSEVLSTETEDPNTKQPSAIINKLSSNSNQPETYHVIVNDGGKKITNANGHVTVIISGPTAQQATMASENSLLIPQTDSSSDMTSNQNLNSLLSRDQSDQPSNSTTIANQSMKSQSTQVGSNSSLHLNKPNGSLSFVQEDTVPALKISEGLENQLNKGKTKNVKASTAEEDHNKSDNPESRKTPIQQGQHLVQVGQDLKDGVDGLQMEEVSRPNIQEEQKQEKENVFMEQGGGGYLEGLEKSMAEQSEAVPTLNIVLDPTHKIGGSFSVGGKVVSLASDKTGDLTDVHKQQLDCRADPKSEKTTVTVLSCQKKHGLPEIPQSYSNEAYFGNGNLGGRSSFQLDQVMNVLNDQVKTTINNEMKTESSDIQKMLTGMTLPSSTLMDIDEANSESEPPQRSSIGPDESYTSPPIIERPHRPRHRKPNYFGFLPHFGFPNHLRSPHRRHFWKSQRHSNPFVVMAHKDSDEGFWDYQHNIFIPRAFNNEEEDNDEDDNREKHWAPWGHQGHRRGSWFMAHPPLHHPRSSPFRRHDLFHLRLPTIFGRSGPWKPSLFNKQEQGTKRTAVVHKTVRGDRDLCKPIIDGPSPPLKGEWEYLGKVLSSCPCRLSDTEW